MGLVGVASGFAFALDTESSESALEALDVVEVVEVAQRDLDNEPYEDDVV